MISIVHRVRNMQLLSIINPFFKGSIKDETE
jgi:hypothetical protein